MTILSILSEILSGFSSSAGSLTHSSIISSINSYFFSVIILSNFFSDFSSFLEIKDFTFLKVELPTSFLIYSSISESLSINFKANQR